MKKLPQALIVIGLLGNIVLILYMCFRLHYMFGIFVLGVIIALAGAFMKEFAPEIEDHDNND